MKKNVIILIVIIFLAFIFRVYQLSHVPPSASLDEVSIGWNAYSILQTGKDEYGYKFPILLRAYDDWRPALYVYLVTPFVKLFGLNVLAVRLPSVILGTLSVLATYFLVLELFKKYKYRKQLGLLSAFFLAISPWSVYISRLGHEANAAFAFGIIAISLFLKFKNSLRPIYLYLSSIFFALSFYAYQSGKIFIPLMVIILAIIFRREILKRRKHVLFSAIIGFIILIPVLQATLSPNGLARLKGTSAFNVDQPQYMHAAIERLKARGGHDVVRGILNNNRIVSAEIFFQNYLLHFDPRWLFGNQGLDDFKAPGVGLLYLFDIPFILLGIYYLLGHFDKKTKVLLLSWILISPVAASFTTGVPHAMRSYSFLPAWQILGALGLIYIVNSFKSASSRKIIVLIVCVIVLINVGYFSRQYFVEFPKKESSSFQYALSRAIVFSWGEKNSFNKIIISDRNNLYQSYMFLLFYSKYDPNLYQREGGTKSGGFAANHSFDKFEFRPVSWSSESQGKGILYIRNILNLTVDTKVFNIKTFSNLDGENKIIAIWKK